MRLISSKTILAFLSVCVTAVPLSAEYEPPAGFYNSATGNGSTLKSQLDSIMTSGHIQRTYGDFRFSAALSDRDPNNSNNILLVYDRDSIDSAWNPNPGGFLPWNREHVWPQSLQPGSASNSSTGNLGDPHALRPSDVQVNSNRGNDPFGFATTTGNHGSVGSFYFPGDADKGDIARSLFYSSTRYNLTLVNGSPGSNQMGDLASLVAWHYLDTPDDFERRRNHVIYSQAENPSYYTNNRNAFVDRPEFVHSVFVDNFNDTQLTLAGGSTGSDGGSTLDLDLGRVIVGAALPAAQTVTLNKAGVDGTYYEVTTSSAAVTSSVTGRYNAFATGSTGSTTLDIGLTGSTATPGTLGGSVTIDNLDVTTGLGSGFGSQDGDDTVNVSLDVLAHANPSFASGTDMNSLTLDFGQVSDVITTPEFSLFNLATGSPGLTAGLDLDSITGVGDTDVLTTNLTAFDALTAATGTMFEANIVDFSNQGTFSATYTLNFSDEDLPGAGSLESLTLTLLAEVVPGLVVGDYNDSGQVEQGDLDLVLQNWGVDTDVAGVPAGWINDIPSGQIEQTELDGVLQNWGTTSSPDFSGTNVPEPGTAAVAAGLVLVLRRGRR